MARKKERKVKWPRLSDADWLRMVEDLIGNYSTVPRTRGKYKGHASTDAVAWISHLTRFCWAYTKYHNRGRYYDENMALTALLGRILVLWYCNVHRAKGFDPNRPLGRRKVFKRLAEYRSALISGIADDRLMGKVWGKKQEWNFPFGKGARGGKFV